MFVETITGEGASESCRDENGIMWRADESPFGDVFEPDLSDPVTVAALATMGWYIASDVAALALESAASDFEKIDGAELSGPDIAGLLRTRAQQIRLA